MKKHLLLILILLSFPLWMGFTTVPKSSQLAPNPHNLDIARTDGKNTIWANRTTVCCDLNETHQVGNIISYTNPVPVVLSATTTEDPTFFMGMYMNTLATFLFQTNGALTVCDPSSGSPSHLLGGSLGSSVFNLSYNSNGDFNWYDHSGTGITADASADAVSIVGTEFNVETPIIKFKTGHQDVGYVPVCTNATTGAWDWATAPSGSETDPLAWLLATSQTLITGDKSGSFDLDSTGDSAATNYVAGRTNAAGTIKIWDGTGNFSIIEQPATVVDTTLRLPAAAPNVFDILVVSGNPGAGLYQLAWVDPVENGQDITGNMATDTATIDATYNDGAGTLTWDVIKQMSITSDASGLKLSGDAAAPGGRQYYGTNAAGTKGFYGYGELGIPADTDTDNYSICFPASCAAQYNAGTPPTVTLNYGTTLTTSDLAIGPKMGIPVSGTATYLSVYISRWTKSIDIPTPLVDTIQVRLYVDGVAASYWETSQGITGGLGGALNNDALTASTTSTSHYVQIFAKISLQGGNADTIIIEAAILNVSIT